MTSLHWAALSGHAPVVEFLLAGVDPNTRSQVGESEGESVSGCDTVPAWSGRRLRFPQQESGGGTALHMAASRGSASVVALLLRDPRVDPNAVDAVSSRSRKSVVPLPLAAFSLPCPPNARKALQPCPKRVALSGRLCSRFF